MEAASLSVSITGDASGLISSLQSAEAAIGQLQSRAAAVMGERASKLLRLTILQPVSQVQRRILQA